MTLKNNSPVIRAVLLIRYADVDADSATSNNFDATLNSAFGWNSLSGGAGFGLELQNIGKPVIFGALSFSHPEGPDSCNPTSNSTIQSGIDGSIGFFVQPECARGGSATVTASYRGM